MKFKTSLALLGATLATTSAFAISYDAATNGTTAPAGVTFTGYTGATEKALGTKTSADGYTSLGVTGGSAGNEIDIGQSLAITFSVPQIVTEITLGLLFNGGEYRDYNEIAVFKLWDGSLLKLTAEGNTTASWTGSGSVTNVAPAVYNKGGVWTIANPFGTSAILGFTLFPENNPAAPKGTNPSDFGLVGFESSVVRVPDVASTVALAGVALMGLGLAARRRA